VSGEKTTAKMAARFVSMIPVVNGNLLFPGLCDVWLTADVSYLKWLFYFTGNCLIL
jgi:hypothetical protein